MKRYKIKDPFDFYMKWIMHHIIKVGDNVWQAYGINQPTRTIKRKY